MSRARTAAAPNGEPKSAASQAPAAPASNTPGTTTEHHARERHTVPSRPWSTNVILLGVGFAVVCLLFKNSGPNSQEVAGKQNGSAGSAASTAAAPNPSHDALPIQSHGFPDTSDAGLGLAPSAEVKPDPAFLLQPLEAPKLPAPMVLALEGDASEPTSPTQSNIEPVQSDSQKSLTVASSQKAIASDVASELNSKAPHESVAIPEASKFSDAWPEPTWGEKDWIDNAASSNKTESASSSPTVVTNPHVARNPIANTRSADSPQQPAGQILATSTPELETEELFKLRSQYNLATMESQQQAMAMGNQQLAPAQQQAFAQWNTGSGGGGPATNMVSNSSPSRPTYNPPAPQTATYNYQQPVQIAPTGYGAGPSVQATINPAPANVTTTPNASMTPASVRQPYVPISGSFAPDQYGFAGQAPTAASVPTQTAPNANPIPVSGGYQPLNPQFQYQPTIGN